MSGLEYLLNLNGEIFPMANDYWVKFETAGQLIEDFWDSVNKYMEQL